MNNNKLRKWMQRKIRKDFLERIMSVLDKKVQLAIISELVFNVHISETPRPSGPDPFQGELH